MSSTLGGFIRLGVGEPTLVFTSADREASFRVSRADYARALVVFFGYGEVEAAEETDRRFERRGPVAVVPGAEQDWRQLSELRGGRGRKKRRPEPRSGTCLEWRGGCGRRFVVVKYGRLPFLCPDCRERGTVAAAGEGVR